MLSFSELQKLAAWAPIAPDFGLERTNTYKDRVRPVFESMSSLNGAEVRVMSGEGGLSNYASAFVHNEKGRSGKVKGLCVYLSLLAPLAAVGRDTAYISGKARGYRMIEPTAVLNFESLDSEFERYVWRAIESGGFRVLSPEEATSQLPEGVTPYEYCLNSEPWNRVFHVLFSDTD
jgi:hypothetical protein